MVGSSAVFRLNFCAKNPPLRQAAKRYAYVPTCLAGISFGTRIEIFN